MRPRDIAFMMVLPAALFAAASCTENDEATPPPTDGGVVDSHDVDAASPEDDGGSNPLPPTCVGEWCSIVLDGMRDVALNAVSGSGPNDVWVVGSKGFVARFNGTAWEEHRIDTLLPIYSVWASNPTDVWAANTGGTLFHWDGLKWEESTLESTPGDMPDNRAVLALGGSGPENLLALVEPSYLFGPACPVPWGESRMGCPLIYRRSRIDGELAWRVASDQSYICDNLIVDGFTCLGLTDSWVDPSGDPWAVGATGRAVRPRGPATPPAIQGGLDETSSIATLQGISGTSSNDVWTVGASGTIRRFVGGAWTTVSSPTNVHLRAVWSRSPDEAWAVGDQGKLLRWDGKSWQLAPSPLDDRPRDLLRVWGDSNGDVWTVGARALMRRRPQPVSQP